MTLTRQIADCLLGGGNRIDPASLRDRADLFPIGDDWHGGPVVHAVAGLVETADRNRTSRGNSTYCRAITSRSAVSTPCDYSSVRGPQFTDHPGILGKNSR